ncbi:hypothetical protein DPMN_004993, partial [Dreissena polymorpha]
SVDTRADYARKKTVVTRAVSSPKEVCRYPSRRCPEVERCHTPSRRCPEVERTDDVYVTGRITVQTVPRIPPYNECIEGDALLTTLICTATFNPAPAYYWVYESEYTNRTHIGTGNQLVLRNLTLNTTGTYTCVAYNLIKGIRHLLFLVRGIPTMMYTLKVKKFDFDLRRLWQPAAIVHVDLPVRLRTPGMNGI